MTVGYSDQSAEKNGSSCLSPETVSYRDQSAEKCVEFSVSYDIGVY